MVNTYSTKDEAIEREIVPAIEASGVARREEYDVDAIFDATFEFDSSAQVFRQSATVEEFWAAVENNRLETT